MDEEIVEVRDSSHSQQWNEILNIGEIQQRLYEEIKSYAENQVIGATELTVENVVPHVEAILSWRMGFKCELINPRIEDRRLIADGYRSVEG